MNAKNLYTLIEEINVKTQTNEQLTHPKTIPTFNEEYEGIIVAKGGTIKKQPYSEGEYLAINAQAEKYSLLIEDYGIYYDYEHGGKECRGTDEKIISIQDENILVKDGQFCGCVLLFIDKSISPSSDLKYFVLLLKENTGKVTISMNYCNSEWGNTYSIESAYLRKK